MPSFIFHQLFERESSTYTYLLGDEASKEAVLIDPVLETVGRDLKLLKELGLKLKYIIETHVHADHITGAAELRAQTGAKTVVSAAAKIPCVDIALKDGAELKFGAHVLKARATPGHTNTCMSYLIEDMAFTGDTLLIRGTGRTDFQSGCPETLYKSITETLFALPAQTRIYPAHDYSGLQHSSVGEEMEHNPRVKVGMTKEAFVELMNGLKLAYPKKIAVAVPANQACGIVKKPDGDLLDFDI
jgi:sulfur dioxygenase